MSQKPRKPCSTCANSTVTPAEIICTRAIDDPDDLAYPRVEIRFQGDPDTEKCRNWIQGKESERGR